MSACARGLLLLVGGGTSASEGMALQIRASHSRSWHLSCSHAYLRHQRQTDPIRCTVHRLQIALAASRVVSWLRRDVTAMSILNLHRHLDGTRHSRSSRLEECTTPTLNHRQMHNRLAVLLAARKGTGAARGRLRAADRRAMQPVEAGCPVVLRSACHTWARRLRFASHGIRCADGYWHMCVPPILRTRAAR